MVYCEIRRTARRTTTRERKEGYTGDIRGIDDFNDDLKEKAVACKTGEELIVFAEAEGVKLASEELIALAKAEGMKPTSDELEVISGDVSWSNASMSHA